MLSAPKSLQSRQTRAELVARSGGLGELQESSLPYSLPSLLQTPRPCTM